MCVKSISVLKDPSHLAVWFWQQLVN